jgi:Fe-Mn family superoxide dismutase
MIRAKTFPNLEFVKGLNPERLRKHLELYHGYIEKGQQLWKQWEKARTRGAAAAAELRSLKVDLTYALSAIKNHELFFDVLGRPPTAATEPQGVLRQAIERDFGSLAVLMDDLRRTALESNGWVWLTIDLDRGFLFCYGGNRQHALPVWNALPILVLDLYVHAYAYDFGEQKSRYIEVLLQNTHWEKVGQRLAAAPVPAP